MKFLEKCLGSILSPEGVELITWVFFLGGGGGGGGNRGASVVANRFQRGTTKIDCQ